MESQCNVSSSCLITIRDFVIVYWPSFGLNLGSKNVIFWAKGVYFFEILTVSTQFYF